MDAGKQNEVVGLCEFWYFLSTTEKEANLIVYGTLKQQFSEIIC